MQLLRSALDRVYNASRIFLSRPQRRARSSASAKRRLLCPALNAGLLHALYGIMPNMARNSFGTLLALRAALTNRTYFANAAFALVLSIALTVGGRVAQNLILRAENAVIILAGDFLQNPLEQSFDHFSSKAAAKRIADRRKMRKRLRHGISQKPAIRHIHFRVFHRLPKQAYPEQMPNQHQLEQHHRIKAGATIVLAVQILHQIIDVREIHRRVRLWLCDKSWGNHKKKDK